MCDSPHSMCLCCMYINYLPTLDLWCTIKKQARYQPVTNFTFWPVLGSYNNWNIINLTPKSTPFDVFDEIHQVVIGRISDNISPLFPPGKYGSMNTSDTKTNEFYVIKFISQEYMLQNNTTIDGKIFMRVNQLSRHNIFAP